MSFNYKSLSGVKLTAEEEEPLLEIDKFNYPLTGYTKLADLHSKITVELSDKQETCTFSYEITPSQRDAEIARLQNKIDEINKLIDQKTQEFNASQGSEKDEIGKQIDELKGERNRLRAIYYVYKNAKRGTNGNYIINGCYMVLGEYISSSKKVILYKNSIHSDNLLAIVYVHEMMHAYLDCGGITLPEIEEPIVEYAMLNFFKAYDKRICAEAEKYVKEKQQVLGITHYGFGYCIFKNPNGVDWLNDYLSAKPRLLPTNKEVKEYLDFWKTGIYPIGKEQACLQALYDSLHTKTKTMRVSGARISVKYVLQELRRMQSKGTLPKTITLSNEIQFGNYLSSCPSINGCYVSYMNSVKRPEFNDLLEKHKLPRNIYSCQDIDKLIDALAELYKKPVSSEAEAALRYGSRSCGPVLCYFIMHLLRINGVII